ncbi:alpha/beta fold hydrolase [Serratia proteamaculans]|uniref:Alpha/beta fold hydrolase n=1 Tax=Serratia proteamaculans TaxID=28151 RepID=A0A7U0N7U0_SERPR|nr:alpha/beta hydrolase [Serratia proteamaculans]MBO1501010.1 alpha/beta fold hydrolase [Serratia proteamaculans]MDW5509931.1 alpha/beta hydrolase [Serratia proteamaculans]QQX54038.1 alpha/beta fold hydrolase [Serratia proteamaculans]
MNTFSLLENHDAPLVLLGGTLCNHRLWQPVVEQLNVSNVISIIVTGADSASAVARQLLATLPARFCLVGFSLGAIVALQMMADAPQRLSGLALLSVNPFTDPPANVTGRRGAVREATRLGISHWLTTTLWPRYVAPHRQCDLALHSTIVNMAVESGIDTLIHQTEIAITRADHRVVLPMFTAPLLIINGASDVICTPEHHQAIASAAPRARWITLPDSGHFLPLEAPQQVAIALRNWIQESKL